MMKGDKDGQTGRRQREEQWVKRQEQFNERKDERRTEHMQTGKSEDVSFPSFPTLSPWESRLLSM